MCASFHFTTFSHAFDLSQRRWDRNVGPICKRADIFRQTDRKMCGFFLCNNFVWSDSPPPGWEYSLQGESSGRL